MVGFLPQQIERAKDRRSAPSRSATRVAADKTKADAGLGNQARLRRLSVAAPRLQAKLDIGAANSPLEQEADAMADRVMRMVDPAALRPNPAGAPRAPAAAAPTLVHDALGTSGRALDEPAREFMESGFGRSFSDVRVHDDERAASSARAVGARAYTVGKDVVFARGAYAPSSGAGLRLIAHELTHVAQQDANGTRALQRQVAEEPTGDTAPSPAAAGPAAKPSRPSTAAFWQAYQQIGYNKWTGEDKTHEVWKFIGGKVGQLFDGQNTCAARVSYGLDYGGAPITPFSANSFFNASSASFEGKAGDDKAYIVGAPAMETHLTKLMGTPDATLTTGKESKDLEDSLPTGLGALFAGDHHSGLIMKGYSDPYVTTSGVLPVSAWKIPA